MKQKYLKIFNENMSRIKKFEPNITNTLETIAKENEGIMVGLETKFKSFESTLRKIKSKIKDKGALFLTAYIFERELINLKDLLRYTIVYEPAHFTQSVKNTLDELKKLNYSLKELKNRFEDEVYKDIITHYSIDDDSIKINFTFEVQFHTPETLKLKSISHHLYEITRQYEIKLNKIDKSIKDNILKALIELYKETEIPEGVSDIQE